MHYRRLMLCGSVLVLGQLFGCSCSESAVTDAGPRDAGARDAGARDAGRTDAGRTDAGRVDAGVRDSGRADAGAPDSGATDAGAPDSGATDAGEVDAGLPPSPRLGAALNWSVPTRIYFFAGDEYFRYSRATNMVDLGLTAVAPNWPGWPTAWTDVDAALLWNGTTAYFFRGAEYLRFDIPGNTVDPGFPAPIAANWPGWPASWTDVDAALEWDGTRVFFFRGNEYLRFDIVDNRVAPGFPAPIAANWPGWPASWTEIDAALKWNDDAVYFFRGDEYILFDIDDNEVPAGYPQSTSPDWPGWPL